MSEFIQRISIFCFVFLLLSLGGNELRLGAQSSEIDTLKKTSRAFNAVAEKAVPAVVHISTVKTVRQSQDPFYDLFGNDEFFRRFFYAPPGMGREFKQKGLGSGVIVSRDGDILTNNHVIEGVDEITVTLSDKRIFKAKLIGTDPKSDIAVLKISGEEFPFIKIGDSDAIKVGDWAIAIGSPFGLSGTMTAGIISAKGRSDVEIIDYSDLIQTDAAINPGNSGGALLSIDGDLIGINTAIYTRTGGYQGIGFAVPVNMARKVMEDIKLEGKVSRGWLGVYIQPVTEELQKQFNLESVTGSLITEVIPKSPADKAGVKRGDVITRFNGKPVSFFRELISRVAETRIGETVELELIRQGKRRIIKVSIESAQPERAASLKREGESDALGLKVETITPDHMKRYRLNSKEGVVIMDVFPDGPSALAGIRPGDVILEINYQPIHSVDEYERVVSKARKDAQFLILIRREGYSQYLVLKAR